jgi:hypothetical protein
LPPSFLDGKAGGLRAIREAERVEHLGHDEQERGEEPDVHFVVAPDDFPRARHGLVRRGVANLQDACAQQPGVAALGRADEHAVFEEVELDGQRAEADFRVARRRDVGVAVADHRHDARHLDDYLVTSQRRNPVVQASDGAFKLPARHRVKQILVAGLHLPRHVAQILAPLLGLRLLRRRARRFNALRKSGGGQEKETEQDRERGGVNSRHAD